MSGSNFVQVTLESLNKVRNGIGLATARASMRMWSCRKLLTHHVLSLQVTKISQWSTNIIQIFHNVPTFHSRFDKFWFYGLKHSNIPLHISRVFDFSTFAFLMKLWKSPRAKVLGPVLCRRSRTSTSHLDLQVGILVTTSVTKMLPWFHVFENQYHLVSLCLTLSCHENPYYNSV